MREIIKVIPKENYFLEVTFDDGETVVVNVRSLMDREIFSPLKDKAFFRQVSVDHKFGGICWPLDLSVCQDWIEEEIKKVSMPQ
jgi:hypothetical protein